MKRKSAMFVWVSAATLLLGAAAHGRYDAVASDGTILDASAAPDLLVKDHDNRIEAIGDMPARNVQVAAALPPMQGLPPLSVVKPAPAITTPGAVPQKQLPALPAKSIKGLSNPATAKKNPSSKVTKTKVVDKTTEKSKVVAPDPLTKIIDYVAYTKKEGEEQEKWVALTFDDGPSPEYTPKILALLKKHKIKATFCVVGRQVKKHPELVKQMVEEGHKIANHSMNHDEFVSFKSAVKMQTEILAENELIESVVPGVKVEYYRAPGGNWNLTVRKRIVSWGMKPLGWSVDTKDWQQPGVESIVTTVKNRVKSGGVILMHDGGGNRSESVEALKQIIPNLKDAGYQFGFPG
ncbi:MAG: polysaccharide deacetylase family protein [Cyanobacteria bacterium]|nr:polysaccharide deacetylase family protein [Cyanobacteriota bacterium]